MTAHKLVKHGTGERSWGRCTCEEWVWLGTYHLPRGRVLAMRREHAAHVLLEAAARCERCWRPIVSQEGEALMKEHGYQLCWCKTGQWLDGQFVRHEGEER